MTALELFHQWWDTEWPAPGLGAGPHCDSPGIAHMNGFPYTCRQAEGGQALVEPFTNAATSPARRRLLHSDELIDVIADRVGYADATHFIRICRRIHGAPPATWRTGNRHPVAVRTR